MLEVFIMDNKYKAVPFWSWNDELDEKELVKQIDWMHESGIGGFFMHARGGLTTPYLGDKWFSCVEACLKRAKELNMEGYAYDENGWPSGFAGMKLLEDPNNCDCYLSYSEGPYDSKALVNYDISTSKLIRVNKGEHCLNIYKHTSNSTADILDEKVVRKFIDLTHEQYKKHDKYGNLKGFFTDEPQYFRWHHAYTNVLPQYFKKHYGIDILDGLGLMFVEKEGYRDFRYKYWNALQDLMIHSFAKQVYDWCDSNNYKLTGHYVEETSLEGQMMCCAGMMPLYEYEHIPGLDWLGRPIGNDISPKQVSSVAQQLGKQQVLTECYALAGWDATPLELKHIGEFLYVNGVNLMCHHLLPYSEHGQRKRDYPEHYSKINPWADKYFKEFNDYFSVLGEKLANSKELVDVAVFHPIKSCYFDYKRDADDHGIKKLNSSLSDLAGELRTKQINYHFVDETLLRKYGSVENGELIMGKCKYKYLIFPLIYTMESSSEKLLREYVKQGGKVLFYSDKPNYLEGSEFDYSFINSNITLEEIKDNQLIKPEDNPNIRFALRENADGSRFVYVVNLGEETTWINNDVNFSSGDVIYGKEIKFDKYESKLLTLTEKKPTFAKKLTPLTLRKEFDIIGEPENYLLLDFIRYSLDGKTYSEPLHYMGIFNELLSKKYGGKVYLKYEFEVDEVPSKCNAMIEDTRLQKVTINGTTVKQNGFVLEKDLLNFDVAKYIKVGHNEIIVEIDYLQKEEVYHALFGENVTESLKNCLAYTTTIEAIYLKGNFGVFGEFTKGKTAEDILLGEHFRIGKMKKHINSIISEGFPFFRGEMTLSQNIHVDDVNKYLLFEERFQTLEVYVNSKRVGLMMFSNELDLSNFLHIGDNHIEIKLIVSNRNLLGTHHEKFFEEDQWVGPYSFERLGTWKDGKSSILRESYSFVKTII